MCRNNIKIDLREIEFGVFGINGVVLAQIIQITCFALCLVFDLKMANW
jgi:hypothetical protein